MLKNVFIRGVRTYVTKRNLPQDIKVINLDDKKHNPNAYTTVLILYSLPKGYNIIANWPSIKLTKKN